MGIPDLNLLLVFDAIMHERNLRRAAERLGRSQPAVSQSVARLRDIFADQLFRRIPTGVEPTPRAEALWAEFREPLALLREQIAPATFDPRNVRAELRIGMADDVHAITFPEVVSSIRAQAPHVVLRAIETDHHAAWRQVRTGFVDLVATVADAPPRGLAGKVLTNLRFVVLRRADIAPPLTLADYLGRSHVALGFSDDRLGYTDRRLEALGTARSVIAWTPRFATIPDLVIRTGAIATMPEPIARRYAASGAVGLSSCPFDLPEVPVWLGWHLRRQADPLNRWAREQVERVVLAALADMPSQ